MHEIYLRQMKSSDLGALMRLKDAEGWNQTEADWLFFLSHNPELCLVACLRGEVVGSVAAINYGDTVSWVGMMLVRSDVRGQGIAKRLLSTVIEKLETCQVIKLDATPAGQPVYQKLGFVAEFGLLRMTGDKLAGFAREREPAELRRMQSVDLPEVVSLDASVMGTDRPELIQRLFQENPEASWIIRKKDGLAGAALVRRGTRFNHIGPVQATSLTDAKVIISRLVDQLRVESIVLDVVASQQELVDWLLAAGFVRQRSLTRMFLGNNVSIANANRNFAICGPEFG
jgi:predicted N-acetyltransferase YhbS